MTEKGRHNKDANKTDRSCPFCPGIGQIHKYLGKAWKVFFIGTQWPQKKTLVGNLGGGTIGLTKIPMPTPIPYPCARKSCIRIYIRDSDPQKDCSEGHLTPSSLSLFRGVGMIIETNFYFKKCLPTQNFICFPGEFC